MGVNLFIKPQRIGYWAECAGLFSAVFVYTVICFYLIRNKVRMSNLKKKYLELAN